MRIKKSLTFKNWIYTDFRTQKALSVYFGLQKITDAQLFKNSFVWDTGRKRRPAPEFGDGTKNIQLEALILIWVGTVVYRLVKWLKIE